MTCAKAAMVYDHGLIKQPKFSASYEISASLVAYANWGAHVPDRER